MTRIQHIQKRKATSVVVLSSLLAGAATQTASAHEETLTTSALAVKNVKPVTQTEVKTELPKEAPNKEATKELTRDEKRAELTTELNKVSAKLKLADNGEIESKDAAIAKKVQKLNLKSEKNVIEKKVNEIDSEVEKEQEANRKQLVEKIAKEEEKKNAKATKTTQVTSAKNAQVTHSTPQSTYTTPSTDTGVQATAGSIRPQIIQSANSYPWGQCTWGVKCLAPWAGNYWGNGNMWAASAASQGFKVGTTPKPGAIAVWSGNHVAYVTDVRSNTEIRVLESNYAGNQNIGDYRGWFNPVNAQGSVSYIYPPGT